MNLLELGVVAAQHPRAVTVYQYDTGKPSDIHVVCADCAFKYVLSMKSAHVAKTMENTTFGTDLRHLDQKCPTCGERMVTYEPT